MIQPWDNPRLRDLQHLRERAYEARLRYFAKQDLSEKELLRVIKTLAFQKRYVYGPNS